jgi:hypothetical protein
MSMRGAFMSLGRWAALVLFCAAAPLPAHESGDCEAFTWDVARELDAMRAQPREVPAAISPQANRVHLQEGTHFIAELRPQESVTFAVTPARKARAEKPTGGLLFFQSAKPGVYRISLSSRHWIDVVDGARVIDSRGHQGRGGCKLLHKVVEFELPAQRLLTIQLSGDDAATAGIVITAVSGS